MDKLMEILTGIRPDLDFETQDKMMDEGVLDSFDIISIVAEVNSTFGTNINFADLLPENFNSADAIWRLIESNLG